MSSDRVEDGGVESGVNKNASTVLLVVKYAINRLMASIEVPSHLVALCAPIPFAGNRSPDETSKY